MPIYIKNRRARFDYEILETIEAGIILTGTEAKAIRLGHVTFQDSFCRLQNQEVFVEKLAISVYIHGNIKNHEPQQQRKLLLHKYEIQRLERKVTQTGLTIIPLAIYFVRNKVKLEIGVARGKNTIDKRKTIKAREADHEAKRATKNN